MFQQTARYNISLDPSIPLILYVMRAIFLIKNGTKNISSNITKVLEHEEKIERNMNNNIL